MFPIMLDESIASAIEKKAKELGFVRCGIAPIEALAHKSAFLEWIDAGKHASMSYMKRDASKRSDPQHLLENAQSAIVVAARYWHPNDQDDVECDNLECSNAEPHLPAKIARYARGEDYHIVLRDRLTQLLEWIQEHICDDFDYRICVDSSPLLERELAKAAGIGFFGKNTLLISPGIGSYTVLGSALTSLPIKTLPEADRLSERCGQCTLCIDHCPTQAIEQPYQLNANKCISYHTIENNGDVPSDIIDKLSDWVFGCDICQEVCPFNTPTSISRSTAADPRLSPRSERIDTGYLLNLGSSEHKRFTKNRALRRNSRTAFIKNAANLIAAKSAHLPRDERKNLLLALDDLSSGTNSYAETAIDHAKSVLKTE